MTEDLGTGEEKNSGAGLAAGAGYCWGVISRRLVSRAEARAVFPIVKRLDRDMMLMNEEKADSSGQWGAWM